MRVQCKGNEFLGSFVAFLVAASLLPVSSESLSLGPAPDPNLPKLLRSQPIVVVAKWNGMVGESSKFFQETSGPDGSNAYTEHYAHHAFEVVKSLQGTLPQSFEVRTMNPLTSAGVPSFEMGAETLMILAPDSGLDPQGNIRDSFLLTDRAAYPLFQGDLISVPTPEGDELWSIQDVARELETIEKERLFQLSRSPEPPESAIEAVHAGEDDFSNPESPPSAVENSQRFLGDPAILESAKPRKLVSVPEPAVLFQLTAGAALLGLIMRRKR